jgi:hypothetical protein
VSFVVITYPLHLFHTYQTISELRKYHPEVTDYYILYDDLYKRGIWKTYRNDLESYISEHFADITVKYIPFSRLEFLTENIPGWIRQQLVKLYSDVLMPLELEQWTLVDGDIINLPRKIPIGIENELVTHGDYLDEIDTLFYEYCKFMIDPNIEVPKYEDMFLIIEPTGIRTVQRSILMDLKQYIERKHHKPLMKFHLNEFDNPYERYTPLLNTSFILSEWNLLYHYKKYVANMDLNHVVYQVGDSHATEPELDYAELKALNVPFPKDLLQKVNKISNL